MKKKLFLFTLILVGSIALTFDSNATKRNDVKQFNPGDGCLVGSPSGYCCIETASGIWCYKKQVQ